MRRYQFSTEALLSIKPFAYPVVSFNVLPFRLLLSSIPRLSFANGVNVGIRPFPFFSDWHNIFFHFKDALNSSRYTSNLHLHPPKIVIPHSEINNTYKYSHIIVLPNNWIVLFNTLSVLFLWAGNACIFCSLLFFFFWKKYYLIHFMYKCCTESIILSIQIKRQRITCGLYLKKT